MFLLFSSMVFSTDLAWGFVDFWVSVGCGGLYGIMALSVGGVFRSIFWVLVSVVLWMGMSWVGWWMGLVSVVLWLGMTRKFVFITWHGD